MPGILKNSPAVFAVGNNYKIFVSVTESAVMWIKVGDECYYDHSNGVLRSATNLHKITVPVAVLDREKSYTVCYRRMFERKPYFSETGEVEEIEYSFSPLPCDTFRAYQIADAHGMIEAPVEAAKKFEAEFGKIDLLIFNGDVIDHSGNLEYFDKFFEISSLITGGTIPVILSRGNHDTRGIYAECIADYTPTRDGYSYFSFRLGSLWGLVLDCGEDKSDTNAEYGNTNCCHAFRLEETKYIESIIANANEEYAADGIKHRVVIAHSPFSMRFSPPFNIEEELYAYWCKLLSDNIKPDVMISGHTHKLCVSMPGSEHDALGQPCPLVVAAEPNKKANSFIGGGFVFENGQITVVFCNKDEILNTYKLSEKKE